MALAVEPGIWPESLSFSDVNMPPVPPGWKGKCESGEAFNASSCNRFTAESLINYYFRS